MEEKSRRRRRSHTPQTKSGTNAFCSPLRIVLIIPIITHSHACGGVGGGQEPCVYSVPNKWQYSMKNAISRMQNDPNKQI